MKKIRWWIFIVSDMKIFCLLRPGLACIRRKCLHCYVCKLNLALSATLCLFIKCNAVKCEGLLLNEKFTVQSFILLTNKMRMSSFRFDVCRWSNPMKTLEKCCFLLLVFHWNDQWRTTENIWTVLEHYKVFSFFKWGNIDLLYEKS